MVKLRRVKIEGLDGARQTGDRVWEVCWRVASKPALRPGKKAARSAAALALAIAQGGARRRQIGIGGQRIAHQPFQHGAVEQGPPVGRHIAALHDKACWPPPLVTADTV